MKYSYKTRLGNWSEEWELEETKYLLLISGLYHNRKKDYLARKDKGTLSTTKHI
jgi:hypothetical protein